MKKRSFKNIGNGKALIFGVLFSTVTLFASLIILSFILSRLENPVALVGIASLVSLLVSAAISSFVTAKHKGEGGTLTVLLSSLIVSIIIFAVSLIHSGGKAELSVLMNSVCYVAVSLLFARIAGIKKKRRIRR